MCIDAVHTSHECYQYYLQPSSERPDSPCSTREFASKRLKLAQVLYYKVRASLFLAKLWILSHQTLDEHASRGTATSILGCIISWEISQLSKTRRVCWHGQHQTPWNFVFSMVDLPWTNFSCVLQMAAPTVPKFCDHRQASMNFQIRKKWVRFTKGQLSLWKYLIESCHHCFIHDYKPFGLLYSA